MLVISRKENESITLEPAEGLDPSLTLREVFGRGPIVFRVIHVGSRRVQLLIKAPDQLRIWRASGLPMGDAASLAIPAANGASGSLPTSEHPPSRSP